MIKVEEFYDLEKLNKRLEETPAHQVINITPIAVFRHAPSYQGQDIIYVLTYRKE